MQMGVVFILVLSVLVLVHELGHFVAALIFGVKVEEFAFGLPFTPALIKIKYRGIQFAIYPLLLGGFVRLHGEDAQGSDVKKSFWNRGKRQRLAVILAGVFMNVLLALVAFGVLYSSAGVPVSNVDKVTLTKVIEKSPADVAGLKEGDRIVAVEGIPVKTLDQFSDLMKSWAGLQVNITIQRGEGIPLFEGIAEKKTEVSIVNVTPRKNPPEGQGALGVGIATYPYLQTKSVGELGPAKFGSMVVKQSLVSTRLWMGRIFDGLRSIGKNLVQGKAPEGVSGPVAIYQLTSLVAGEGFLPLVELIAILSVNLAVFNVLPIPALDGGRAFFIVLEILLKKRIPVEVEQKVNSWGMAFLLGLMVLISMQDVIRLGVLSKIFGK